MEPFLFHGFKTYNIDILLSVIDSGYILSRRSIVNNGLQYNGNCNNIFNGQDWISLSQKSLIDDRLVDIYRSSYDEFIFSKICIVINSKGLDIKYTNMINWDNCYPDILKTFVKDNSDIRYSYYMDEVQVRDSIPVDNFLAIGYPIRSGGSTDKVIDDLNRIRKSLIENKLNIPIVNSDIYTFGDNKEKLLKSKLIFK